MPRSHFSSAIALLALILSQVPAWGADFPAPESAACASWRTARTNFAPLEAQWHSPQGVNDLGRQVDQKKTADLIDRLYSERNAEIMGQIGPDEVINKWAVAIDSVSESKLDYGGGAKDYIEVKAHIACRDINVSVSSEPILAEPPTVDRLANAQPGSLMWVSGTLEEHDRPAQSMPDSIQWGGPLWGPFGGLWSDAFEQPAIRLKDAKFEN